MITLWRVLPKFRITCWYWHYDVNFHSVTSLDQRKYFVRDSEKKSWDEKVHASEVYRCRGWRETKKCAFGSLILCLWVLTRVKMKRKRKILKLPFQMVESLQGEKNNGQGWKSKLNFQHMGRFDGKQSCRINFSIILVLPTK